MTGERDAEGQPAQDRHERVPGYDVARAVAICGMVLINFGVYLLGPPRGTPGEIALRWLAHVPGGRASSLFVTLAGVGIARMAYGDVALGRKTLLKRSALLVAFGVTNLLLGWWIDILHFYACYLAIAALFFLRATPRALLASAVAFGLAGGVLAFAFPEEGRSHIAYSTIELLRAAITEGVAPTIPWPEVARQCAVAALRDALIDGIHPVLPWLAFLLFGMWLGRLDLRVLALRRVVLARALAIFALTELTSLALSALAIRNESPALAPLFTLVHTDWSPSPLYVLSASATATAIISLAHELVDRAPKHVLVRLLGNAGQLSLTLYLVHAHLAIGIPRFLPSIASAISIGLAKAHLPVTLPSTLFEEHDSMSIEQMLAYWVAFVVVVLPLAALYRSRFRRGPAEWLMRKITGSPDHVPPLTQAEVEVSEPARWAWPVLLAVIAVLPLADVIGVAPPMPSCAERRGLDVESETPGQLTLLCPRARFAVELDAPTPLVLTTRSGLDVYLEVRREGAMIVEDDDSGPGFDSRIAATLGPGRYDIDVRPYSAATGPFVLHLGRDRDR